MATAPPAVEAAGLTVRYGSKTAVDRTDLAAAPGEVVALLGRNGAGKTSTVEALEGYRRISAGRVRVLGLDPQERSGHRALTGRMGVMLQRGGVYPGMGPAEALRLFASYYERPLDPGELMARLDLEGVAATPWRRLSGGEQQRLSMALALVGRPEVVFLDEPTAGVDPGGRLAIRGQIADLRAAGVTVVLTTHELEEAERVADRIVIMSRGRVVASGTAAELAAADPGGARIRFGAPPGLDAVALGQEMEAQVTEDRPGEYTVARAGDPAAVARLTSWLAGRNLPLRDLRTGSRLEEVFLQLTAGEEDR
ncbi:MAG: ABC transporter ATP-binding protein [Actinomycetota bacterium]|nr:ABC transporter ATP-binding protein [Actinomycetota bacterium]